MILQLSLFEEVSNKKGVCSDCTHCMNHEWYNERYRRCKARPTNTMLKIPYIVIKPNDIGCGLFKMK